MTVALDCRPALHAPYFGGSRPGDGDHERDDGPPRAGLRPDPPHLCRHVELAPLLQVHPHKLPGQEHGRARGLATPGSRDDPPASSCRILYRSKSGLPTGTTARPLMPFITPAADVYQATTAVMTPMTPPT